MVEARVDRSWIFVVTVAALVLLPISTSTQAHAEEEGRIQITFSKPGHGSGSGYLFYQGQKYGLDVSATKVVRIWSPQSISSVLYLICAVQGIFSAPTMAAILKPR